MNWAYVAGFFDGEGCISIQSDAIRVTFAQSVKQDEVLHRIAAFLESEGIAVGWTTQKPRPVGASPVRMLRVSTKEAHVRKFLANTRPHLIVKRERALEALHWFEQRNQRRLAA